MKEPGSDAANAPEGWWVAASTSGADWSFWLGSGATARPPFAQANTRCLTGARGQARDLVGTLSDLLHDHGLSMTDLAGLVVDSGPGSFTSLRMGLATIRALGWALRLPVATVSSLDGMAARAVLEGMGPRIACVVPARRGSWYVATYAPEQASDSTDLQACIASRATVQLSDGDLAPYLTQRLGAQGWTGVGPVPQVLRPISMGDPWLDDTAPLACWLAHVAAVRPLWGDAHQAVPLYLAVSEAEVAAASVVPDVAGHPISQLFP